MSLEAILKNLQGQFGTGSVRLAGVTDSPQSNVAVALTPSYRLNKALGVGGLPYGRIVEIYGTESGGKTTLMLGTMALAQKAGKTVALIDSEYSHMDSYAQACGVDISKLLVLQPNNGEEAVEMARTAFNNGVDFVGIDSIASMVPKVELEGDVTDAHMGAHPRLIGRMCRVLTPLLDNKKILVCINQIREKLGVMYGSNETTTGGRALKFYSSVRLDVRIKDRQATYNDIKIRIVKNKVGTPYKEVETRIIFGSGIDRIYELVDELVEAEVIGSKNGGWYTLKGVNICQGKNTLIEKLHSDQDFLAQMEGALKLLYE